jgi:hypothetical protein
MIMGWVQLTGSSPLVLGSEESAGQTAYWNIGLLLINIRTPPEFSAVEGVLHRCALSTRFHGQYRDIVTFLLHIIIFCDSASFFPPGPVIGFHRVLPGKYSLTRVYIYTGYCSIRVLQCARKGLNGLLIGSTRTSHCTGHTMAYVLYKGFLPRVNSIDVPLRRGNRMCCTFALDGWLLGVSIL